jgi:fructose-1,6-bisphosphatase II
VYARLWTNISGAWLYNDYTYTSCSGCTATKAVMTSPASGSTLTASAVTFTWSNSLASQYYLQVGTTVGGQELYSAGQGTNLSAEVTGLPIGGGNVYVRLWSELGGAWWYNDYSYVACSGCTPTLAVMTTPAPGATLSASMVTFTWGTSLASECYLQVGTTAGGQEIYSAGEGTNLVANGLPNSIAVLAVAEKGGLLNAPDTYMKKLAVGPKAAPYVHIDASVKENLQVVANALERPIDDITVIILDRPRHKQLVEDVRAAGSKIKLISDGDVDACIATSVENTGVHVAMGTGGAPEGVLAAAALKCLGGGFMGRLEPRNDDEVKRAKEMGFDDVTKVLTMDDLVRTADVAFVATGITDGDLVRGVRFFGNGARTHSIVMNSLAGTIRFVETIHRLRAEPFRVH